MAVSNKITEKIPVNFVLYVEIFLYSDND